jgi:Tol biopolymer transport system component
MDRATVAPALVTEQLERLLQSDVFRGTGRSSKLLRFLVEETLEGRGDRLKDYTLGAEALGRGDDFDPRTDPIARVEASRLRSRLELYYATEGAGDRVLITLPKGAYVPQFELRRTIVDQSTAPVRHNRPSTAVLAGLAAVAAAAVAAGALWWRSAPRVPAPVEMRLEITTPPTTDPVSFALSPDGTRIVFVASAGGAARLWLRGLNTVPGRPLARTEDASLPFWSPDSKSIGFFADERLKRIDVETGLVETLTRAAVPGGAAWNRDGTIVFAATIDSPLVSISISSKGGGRPRNLTVLAPGQTGHRGPQFLPDGRHFIYYAMGSAEVRGIYLADMAGTMSRRLSDADTPALYGADQLLFVRQGTLFAQRFDPVRLELAGQPTPIAEEVASGTRANLGAISVSASGLIAYRTGSPGGKRQFVWFDRSGRELARLGDPHSFGPAYSAMSPDSRHLAVQRTVDGNTDIWLLDLDRDTTALRFTSNPEADIAPLWSPAGDRLVFSSRRKGNRFNMYEQPVTATAAADLMASDQAKSATAWSRDGRFLLFRSLDPELSWDVWAMPMIGDRKPFAVVRTRFEERDAQFSPDARWISYQSDESGRFEIYVQPFQRDGPRKRISTDGGVQPFWARDGSELFYLALDGRLMAVPVRATATAGDLETSAVRPLFAARVGGLQDISLRHYHVSPDSQRFLVDTVVEETASPIVIVLNWKPAS